VSSVPHLTYTFRERLSFCIAMDEEKLTRGFVDRNGDPIGKCLWAWHDSSQICYLGNDALSLERRNLCEDPG